MIFKKIRVSVRCTGVFGVVRKIRKALDNLKKYVIIIVGKEVYKKWETIK